MVLTYPLFARNSPRFWLSGCGIFDENWGNSSLHLSCARPNLLPCRRPNLLQPMSLNLRQQRLLRSRTVHRNGLAHRLPMASLVPPLPRNPTGRFVALPTTRSIRRLGAPSAMVPYGSCMPHALVIAVPARGSAQCQESSTTLKPRRVSAVLWPLSSSHAGPSPPPDPASAPPSSAPVLWRDWPRCSIRRTWLKVVRSQTVCLESSSQLVPPLAKTPAEKILTRAERAHWRLSWEQRLTRNARPLDAPRLVVTLHGLPATFASSFGFDLLATA